MGTCGNATARDGSMSANTPPHHGQGGGVRGRTTARSVAFFLLLLAAASLGAAAANLGTVRVPGSTPGKAFWHSTPAAVAAMSAAPAAKRPSVETPGSKQSSSSNSSSSRHPLSPDDSASTVDSSTLPVVAPDAPDTYLPYVHVDAEVAATHRLADGSSASCISRGMQEKCLFKNLIVEQNRFFLYGHVAEQRFPNPIYPADGQTGPLLKYHKYSGHALRALSAAQSAAAQGVGAAALVPGVPCTHVVTRPVVFLFRMSGHSTYHLWENNLGPFFATLQESFGDGPDLVAKMNDPSQLIISFVDLKPRRGPKAPHLLDQLLRTFTNLPLINASQIARRTCFTRAVVGVAANSFNHRKLLMRMMENIAGYSPPPPLPAQPRCIYVSRNHVTVTRGRKIANEDEMLAALNDTVFALTGAPVVKVHYEEMAYAAQVKLAMRTNIMFAPHGGGVANCIWMRRGSVMTEFVAPVGKTLPNMYHSMCSRSGVSHIHFLAEPDPADAGLPRSALNNNPRLFSNMLVPRERIMEHAKRAIELYRENRRKEELRAGSH